MSGNSVNSLGNSRNNLVSVVGQVNAGFTGFGIYSTMRSGDNKTEFAETRDEEHYYGELYHSDLEEPNDEIDLNSVSLDFDDGKTVFQNSMRNQESFDNTCFSILSRMFFDYLWEPWNLEQYVSCSRSEGLEVLQHRGVVRSQVITRKHPQFFGNLRVI